jgi:hypothetical protein
MLVCLRRRSNQPLDRDARPNQKEFSYTYVSTKSPAPAKTYISTSTTTTIISAAFENATPNTQQLLAALLVRIYALYHLPLALLLQPLSESKSCSYRHPTEGKEAGYHGGGSGIVHSAYCGCCDSKDRRVETSQAPGEGEGREETTGGEGGCG